MTTALAAALVNFLWEGAALGLVAWLGISLARTPRMRYLIGIVALAAMAAAPIATGVYFARSAEVQGPSSTVHGSQPFQVLGSSSGGVDPGRGTENGREPGTMDRGPWTFPAITQLDPRIASTVLIAWMIGVALLSMRLAVGWGSARRLTRRVTAAGADVQAAANRLIVALNIRARVRVAESLFVKVPAVVGAFKPVVLLPAAAMSGLSMEQVEALLAHELAHVRRHDYLVNLLQSAVETLLFYHPAVWLVSRRVRQERELCCDDLALSVCGDRVAYASALADLESLRAIPSPALAATGGSLLTRVRRILGHEEVSALAGRSQSLAGVAILASIILLAGGQAARARTIPPPVSGAEEIVAADDTGGRRSPYAPQIPGTVVGVSGSVVGGVQGGVVGGAQGGVPTGIVGGVPSGVASAVTGGAVDGVVGGVQSGVGDKPVLPVERSSEVPPEPQQPVGPAINIGHMIRLEVTVGVVRQMEFNKDYTVQPDGTIQVPYLGAVKAAGLTTAALQEGIAAALIAKGTLPGARVVASIEGRSSSESVWVLGEVASPGAYPWREGFTVEQMISLAGGVTPRGSAARVHLQSNDDPVKPSQVVAAGTTIMVPQKIFASVTVQGAIRTPGNIALQEGRLNVVDAIAAAGGLQASAGSRVWLKRAGSPDVTFTREALMRGLAGDISVRDRDTITVEVAPHFYVTGYVKSRNSEFNWEPGMTLQKAIALAGGIAPEGAANRMEIQRKDPKTGKFAKVTLDKNQMSTPIQPDDVIKVPAKRM